MAGQTLPSWSEQGNPHYSLTDEQCEANEKENDRRAAVLETALRAALAAIGAERRLTIWITHHPGETTHTRIGDDGDSLEGIVWQDAQDRADSFIPEGQGW